MEIKNLQTLKMGKGNKVFNAYFTLDLIPFHLIIKYKLTYHEVDFGYGKGGYSSAPEYIEKFYTKEVYQMMINLVCEKLELEPRELVSFSHHRTMSEFDFKNDDYCYEYHYTNAFHYEFYTKTKIKNALKTYVQYDKILENTDFKDLNGDFSKMHRQMYRVIEKLKKQKVFTNRDYYNLSHATVERFIENFKMKAK